MARKFILDYVKLVFEQFFVVLGFMVLVTFLSELPKLAKTMEFGFIGLGIALYAGVNFLSQIPDVMGAVFDGAVGFSSDGITRGMTNPLERTKNESMKTFRKDGKNRISYSLPNSENATLKDKIKHIGATAVNSPTGRLATGVGRMGAKVGVGGVAVATSLYNQARRKEYNFDNAESSKKVNTGAHIHQDRPRGNFSKEYRHQGFDHLEGVEQSQMQDYEVSAEHLPTKENLQKKLNEINDTEVRDFQVEDYNFVASARSGAFDDVQEGYSEEIKNSSPYFEKNQHQHLTRANELYYDLKQKDPESWSSEEKEFMNGVGKRMNQTYKKIRKKGVREGVGNLSNSNRGIVYNVDEQRRRSINRRGVKRRFNNNYTIGTSEDHKEILADITERAPDDYHQVKGEEGQTIIERREYNIGDKQVTVTTTNDNRDAYVSVSEFNFETEEYEKNEELSFRLENVGYTDNGELAPRETEEREDDQEED